MLTKAKAEEILGKRARGYRYPPDQVAEWFLEAYQLLAKKGWCQGAYARSRKGYKLESGKSKHAATFCAQGALERVAPEYKDFRVCKLLLAYALGVLPNGRWTIAAVNDGPDKDRAKQEIMDGYRFVQTTLAGLE